MSEKNIPLWLAVIISINVIIGSGVYVNPAPLTSIAGALGVLSYFGVALLFLPLVLSIAQLSLLYPNAYGGLYYYSKQELGRTAGVLSGCAYFIGKTFSCAVLARLFAEYARHIIPAFAMVPVAAIAVLMLTALVTLNLFGVKTGQKMQIGFIIFKLLPVVFVAIACGLIFDGGNFTAAPLNLPGFVSSLPVALFALLGFESCCAIGHTIRNAEKNLYRAVTLSFYFTTLIYSIFQFGLFSSLGHALASAQIPLRAFAEKLTGLYPTFALIAGPFFNVAIMMSALGGCFAILFVNSWNGFAVAEEMSSNVVGKFFSFLNHHKVPNRVLWLQGVGAALWVASGAPLVTLARCAVTGVVSSYIFCALALLAAYRKPSRVIRLPYWVAVLGLCSSLFIGGICLKDLVAALLAS